MWVGILQRRSWDEDFAGSGAVLTETILTETMLGVGRDLTETSLFFFWNEPSEIGKRAEIGKPAARNNGVPVGIFWGM